MTISRSRLIASAAAAALLVALLLYQAVAASSSGLSTADENHDGKVTWQEWDDQTKASFTALDTNKDGVLSPDEIYNGFSVLDANHDNVIEPSESDTIASQADSNKNGTVSRQEFDAWVQKYGKGGIFRSGNVSRAQYEESRQQIFTRADSDHDGQLRIDMKHGNGITLFRF